MVYWKTNRSPERLLSAIFAAHPNIKLDSHAIAACYGEGATHVAIENRMRFHRKEGEKLQDGVGGLGGLYPTSRNPTSTPRTPRSRNRKRKRRANTLTTSSEKSLKRGYPSLSSSDSEPAEDTPSKKPKVKAEESGSTVLDPIFLAGDDDLSGDSDSNGYGFTRVKEEEDAVHSQGVRIKVKKSGTPAPPLPSPSQPPRQRPSMAAILSQPRVDSQSCAYDDLFICGEGKVRDRQRAVNVEKAMAYYADCDGSEYVI